MNHKIYTMPFAKVYPMLIAKAERKGRTKDEVLQITTWLTGYSPEAIEAHMQGNKLWRLLFRGTPAQSRSQVDYWERVWSGCRAH